MPNPVPRFRARGPSRLPSAELRWRERDSGLPGGFVARCLFLCRESFGVLFRSFSADLCRGTLPLRERHRPSMATGPSVRVPVCFFRNHFALPSPGFPGARYTRKYLGGHRLCCGSPPRDWRRGAVPESSLTRSHLWAGFQAKRFDVPESLGIERDGRGADKVGRDGRESILVDEIDEGLLFGDDLLDAIELGFAKFLVGGGCLFLHELVDFRFPGRCGRFLIWVPLVVFTGAQPDC